MARVFYKVHLYRNEILSWNVYLSRAHYLKLKLAIEDNQFGILWLPHWLPENGKFSHFGRMGVHPEGLEIKSAKEVVEDSV